MTRTARLFHIIRDISDFKSFIREGGKPIGNGLDGQEDGLFLSVSLDAAKDFLSVFHTPRDFPHSPERSDDRVIAQFDIPLSQIKYPDWKLDVAIESRKLFASVFSEMPGLVNKAGEKVSLDFSAVTHSRPDGKAGTVESFKYIPYDDLTKEQIYEHKEPPGFGGIAASVRNKEGQIEEIFILSTPNSYIKHLPELEKITRYLCENRPEFRAKYDALLQQVLTDGYGRAVKYTGEKPLPVNKMLYAEYDAQKGGHILFDLMTPEKPSPLHNYLTRGNRR